MSERHGEEEGGQHTTQDAPPGWARLVLPALLLAVGVGIYMIVSDYEPPPVEEPVVFAPSHTWRFAEPGTYYIWTDHEQHLQSTGDLARVPTWTHGVLEVWHPDWGARPRSEGGYIVDVQGAKLGDVLEAKLETRSYIWRASQATDEGNAAAQLTVFLAQEIAASHPESYRSLHAEHAMEQFKLIEARLPPTPEELLAAYKKKMAEARAKREALMKKN